VDVVVVLGGKVNWALDDPGKLEQSLAGLPLRAGRILGMDLNLGSFRQFDAGGEWNGSLFDLGHESHRIGKLAGTEGRGNPRGVKVSLPPLTLVGQRGHAKGRSGTDLGLALEEDHSERGS
jgi:hypothetical protein